jgi:hypothetical protein
MSNRNHWYTISVNPYRDGNYETGTRRTRDEIKEARAALREAITVGRHRGTDAKFKTRLEADRALAMSGLPVETYTVCETCNFF